MCGAEVMGLLGSCHHMAEQRAHHAPPKIQHVQVRFGMEAPNLGQNCPCKANMCRQCSDLVLVIVAGILCLLL